MNTPVFCGQEPSFMGGSFDDEETYKERTTQAQRLSGNPVNKNKEFFSIYFHGELENMMGFDIVSFIDGTFPVIKDGDRVKCIAITPDDEKHDAITYVGKRVYDNLLYCLVLLASEELEGDEAEGGSVTFSNHHPGEKGKGLA